MIFLFILVLLIISSHTYIAYLSFILAMLNIIFYMFILGYYYLGLIYILIYIGSIAVLFAYLLMMLSLIIDINYGHILFIFPILLCIILGIFIFGNYNYIEIQDELINFNILDISYLLYTEILIPIGILLFLAMVFAIKYI